MPLPWTGTVEGPKTEKHMSVLQEPLVGHGEVGIGTGGYAVQASL